MSYCVKCKKNTLDLDKDVLVDKELKKAMYISKCSDCDSNKSKFMSNNELSLLMNKLKLQGNGLEEDEEDDEEDRKEEVESGSEPEYDDFDESEINLE